MFKKTKEIVEVIPIPTFDVKRVLFLLDVYEREQTHSTRYNLWSYLNEIVPETCEGKWTLDVSQICHPTIKRTGD